MDFGRNAGSGAPPSSKKGKGGASKKGKGKGGGAGECAGRGAIVVAGDFNSDATDPTAASVVARFLTEGEVGPEHRERENGAMRAAGTPHPPFSPRAQQLLIPPPLRPA